MAAYSDRTLTDWAMLSVPGISPGARWPLSRDVPTYREHYTCGAPRCVWPLVCLSVTTVEVSPSSALWLWMPNSIGGQSGSLVRTKAGVGKGLLTWSWNGRGAGQQTHWIYKQASQRSTDAPERPAGLVEVAHPRSPTQNGFFAEASIVDLPIWDGGGEPPPADNAEQKLRDYLADRGIDWPALIAAVVALLRALGVMP
jgi:hypothetical protein